MELSKAGLNVVSLESMGGFFAVIYDLLHFSLTNASKNNRSFRNRIFNKCFMPVIAGVFRLLDKIYIYKSKWITTGFYVVATKRK
jgi:hypothetical protein